MIERDDSRAKNDCFSSENTHFWELIYEYFTMIAWLDPQSAHSPKKFSQLNYPQPLQQAQGRQDGEAALKSSGFQ
jgi:hypothetical protein